MGFLRVFLKEIRILKNNVKVIILFRIDSLNNLKIIDIWYF